MLRQSARIGGGSSIPEEPGIRATPHNRYCVERHIDFARMGLIHDPETGRRRVVHALIFTAVYSRHMFVWLTFGPTLEAIVAGCEAAWRFFGGVSQLGGIQAGDGNSYDVQLIPTADASAG